jgi:glutathione S-transferase
MLKIWGRLNSINVQKVLWCCGELGLKYERVDAGNEYGVNDTPAYHALNPNGLVPTIEDDGFVLWESNAIIRYLSSKVEGETLCPLDIQTRFDAERWMDWQATTFWPGLRPLFIQLLRTKEAQRSIDVIRKGQRDCLSAIRILDARLSDRDYLAGDQFTFADIPAATTVHRWYELDISHPDLPNLRRWYEQMTERLPFREAVMTPLS